MVKLNRYLRVMQRFVCALSLLILFLVAVSGCSKDVPTENDEKSQTDKPCSSQDQIAIFAKNSPFNDDYNPPGVKATKRLWAKSILWEKAPDLTVGKWLTEVPDTRNKCVLIEFWATWCPPCRRSIHLLNSLHEKFPGELVVIGLSDEAEDDVKNLIEPEMKYYSAIDTQARMKNALGVTAVPHIIIVEPSGSVVWEGFPFLKDYELTEEIAGQILQVARTQKEQTDTNDTD